MLDSTLPYQLPPFYKIQEESEKYRMFIFSGSSEEGVRKVAVDVAKREYVCEDKIKEFMGIFDETLPDERDIEIEFEVDVPSFAIYQMFASSRVQIVKSRAILN